MRTQNIALLFPVAIFLMVLGGLVVVMFLGVPSSQAPDDSPGWVISLNPVDRVWPRFEVDAEDSAPTDASRRIELPALGEIAVSTKDRFREGASQIEIAYEARVDLSRAADLQGWLDYESMMGPSITPADRQWIANAMGTESIKDAGLLAESMAAWSESTDSEPWFIDDAEQRLTIDLQLLVRLAIREVLYLRGLDVTAEDVDAEVQRHIPVEWLRLKIVAVEPIQGN